MSRIAATLVITALLAAGTMSSGASASSRSRTRSITIHARSVLLHAHLVDNPPAGRSPGDVLVFTERLFGNSGRVIGSDAATCTYLFDQRSLCVGAYRLRGGEVLVSLLQPGPTGTYDQAITGGTGRFARAAGTVTVHQHPSSGDRFVFHIHLPAR
jgi:hypothetical protein